MDCDVINFASLENLQTQSLRLTVLTFKLHYRHDKKVSTTQQKC